MNLIFSEIFSRNRLKVLSIYYLERLVFPRYICFSNYNSTIIISPFKNKSLLSFWLKINESLKIKIKCSKELSHTDLKCHFQSKMKKKSKMLWHQFFGLITCYRPGSNQIRRNLLLKTY